MTNRTAIIICSYNMPEYTDALYEHIVKTVHVPYDLIIVDNGSDIAEPSKYTTFAIPENVQTTQGFLQGYEFADSLRKDYFAYWHIITSTKFNKYDTRDILAPMLDVLENDSKAYAVSPAMVFGYDQAWSRIMTPRGAGIRKENNIDYIASVFRADYFNQIGRFRPELTMMWGVVGECNWKARKAGYNLYVHDDYFMYKDTNVGYNMHRMNMSVDDRTHSASAEADRVLVPIYGEDFRKRHWHEYPR